MKLFKLKPCPFCGSLGEVHKKNLGTYIVECTNNSCPASYMIGYDYDSVEEAIDAWNTRQEGGEVNGQEKDCQRIGNGSQL